MGRKTLAKNLLLFSSGKLNIFGLAMQLCIRKNSNGQLQIFFNYFSGLENWIAQVQNNHTHRHYSPDV